MYKTELINYINQDKYAKKIFCGVKALNELPKMKIEKPCAFIVNTEKADKRGEHWFSIYIPIYGPMEYFDSFGGRPQHKEVYNLFKLNGNKYIYNQKPIQNYFSDTCGYYCLLYIFLRSRKISLFKIINIFVKFRDINDKIIVKLFNILNKLKYN